MPRLTVQLCDLCRCNIRGTVVALPHPERAHETTDLCATCAEAHGFECAGCSTRYHPLEAAVWHDDHTYCTECDPRETCNECGSVLDENDPDERVRVRSTSGTYNHFCNEQCANHAGFEQDENGRFYRRSQVEGVTMIPWRSARRSPFRMNKAANGSEITFGVEIENRFTHAPRQWEVKADASLTYSGSNCWEMISPVMRGTSGLRQLTGMLDAWKRHNPSEAKNAGTHVHVGVGHLTIDELALLTEHWERWGEDFASGIVTRKRFANEYCKSIKADRISDFIRRSWCNHPSVAPAATRVESIRNPSIERTAGGMERRKAYNILSIFKHGTVEFRLWSASTNPRKIVGWAAFCVNFVAMAQRLDKRLTPEVVARLCERYGVMRVGLKMLNAGAAFSTWTRERWDELARRNDISLDHLARRTAYPWGRNPDKPPRYPSTSRQVDGPRQSSVVADGNNRRDSARGQTTIQGRTYNAIFTDEIDSGMGEVATTARRLPTPVAVPPAVFDAAAHAANTIALAGAMGPYAAQPLTREQVREQLERMRRAPLTMDRAVGSDETIVFRRDENGREIHQVLRTSPIDVDIYGRPTHERYVPNPEPTTSGPGCNCAECERDRRRVAADLLERRRARDALTNPTGASIPTCPCDACERARAREANPG